MPELGTIVRRCSLLARGVVTHLVTWFRGGFSLTTWLQTIGTLLLGIQRCSSVRLRATAHDGRSVRGLLYLVAALMGDYAQEHSQNRLGTGAGVKRLHLLSPHGLHMISIRSPHALHLVTSW